MNNPRKPLDTYTPGQRVELTAEISNPKTGVAFDPAEVTCSVVQADGSQETPDVENPSPGSYVAFVVIAEGEGNGGYRFDAKDGEGKALGANEFGFRVQARVVPAPA